MGEHRTERQKAKGRMQKSESRGQSDCSALSLSLDFCLLHSAFSLARPARVGANLPLMAHASSREDSEREHQIFWMLIKGSRDRAVGRVYLAIQAALAYGAGRVNVGWLMGEMMAQGRRTMTAECEKIGAGGLAYFQWLYEVELVEAGLAEVHEYRFRRRCDRKEVLASLKTASDPRSLHFEQRYERERHKLEKKRERFIAGYRRGTSDEFFERHSGGADEPPMAD